MSYTSPRLKFDDAKAALREMIAAFSEPEFASRLEEARNAAGNDMLQHMQIVFPLTTEIQQEIIKKYGFPGDREGLFDFTLLCKAFAKDVPDIHELNQELKQLMVPTVTLPESQTGTN